MANLHQLTCRGDGVWGVRTSEFFRYFLVKNHISIRMFEFSGLMFEFLCLRTFTWWFSFYGQSKCRTSGGGGGIMFLDKPGQTGEGVWKYWLVPKFLWRTRWIIKSRWTQGLLKFFPRFRFYIHTSFHKNRIDIIEPCDSNKINVLCFKNLRRLED